MAHAHMRLALSSGVAKPQHTQARARATFACALAFTCRSFELVAARKRVSMRSKEGRG